MTYHGVVICFASIMQASAKPCRVLPYIFPVFTPTEFTVTELCDDNAGTRLVPFSLARISCFQTYNLSLLVVLVFSSDIGTELVTIESTVETTRRGGSSRYRRCRCRTLLYLPCIFRLRTEIIWVSATLRILIY